MTWIPTALGRPENPEPIEPMTRTLKERGLVLVTGGLGSIGLAVTDVLDEYGVDWVSTDVDEMDVTDPRQVARTMAIFEPATILHLAGAKHAPEGELDPMTPVRVHVDGTRNVLDYAPVGCRVVTASTCKACDPETAYGASKLIAERLTLNAGQSVARFHNVVDTVGNVFELWRALDENEPLEVTSCFRYFVSSIEAVSLLLYAATVGEPGRFSLEDIESQYVPDVAARLYPKRERRYVKRRRGDRLDEPFSASCEDTKLETEHICRVTGAHDPVAVTA